MNNYNLVRKIFNHQSKNIFYRALTQPKPLCRNCTMRRALLYVPGQSLQKLKKAVTLNADCIIMDCEDGVAQNNKQLARESIRQMLDEGPVTKKQPEWSVRVNPVQTPELCEADLEALLTAKNLPASICLPKVNHVDDLQWFAEKVWNVLLKRPENDRGPLKLIMYIESPLAIMTLPELCKKALDLSTMAPLVPVALVMGSDDLVASLGVSRTSSGVEIFYARQKLVLVAKAFGLQAIDMVFLNYKNLTRFKENCEEGAIFGFTGKQVIHPDQVIICQEAFVPPPNRIKWAKDVISNFEKYQEKGVGAFTFKNQMIDMPTVRQAQNILNVAKAAGKLDALEGEKFKDD